ncbi:MAG: aminotransferase class III-fold pyridoxal phosphate-dependent enzyme [Ruminococcaceae bacterium]|nr:aminotransferase class III-fold pyridoxal phosphate-dependent enzyme [Oscillospiraceae bacterium]
MSSYFDGFDFKGIHEKSKELLLNPKNLTDEARAKYLNYFETKCAKSKASVEAAKDHIPGGIQHNLANSYPFGINCVKAEGPYLYDIDGNRYIDFLQAGGPTILGNNYRPITDAAINMLNTTGNLTGLYGEFEVDLAKKIKQHYPAVDLFRMLASGTEAGMIAIRMARAFTGKSEIIKINGCYHGWADQLLYDMRSVDSRNMFAIGVPDDCLNHMCSVYPNDIEELEQRFIENEEKGGTAAFIMEPIGQDSGALPIVKEFHQKARELCDKYGALLIYDEVVTAFRLGMGGASAYFGIKPDLIMFGKAIAGGFPAAGGIGGRADVMGCLSAGIASSGAKVMVGGTLSANPVSCIAGYTAICEMEKTNAHAKLKEASDRFTRQIADLADKYKLPAAIFNQHSILHFDLCGIQHLTSHRDDDEIIENCFGLLPGANTRMKEFAMALAAEGLIVAGGNKAFISLATIPVLDEALEIFERVFANYA